MNGNLYARFESQFRARGGQPCLRLPDGPDWTYAELEARVAAAAGALAAFGVGPGDRVVVQTAKTPEAVALYLGCLQAGAVYVPLNTAYTAREVEYFLEDAEPALFVSGAAAPIASGVPVATLDAVGGGSFTNAARTARAVTGAAERAAEDLAAIVYTSGTTGRSKGAMLTHGNLASNAATLCDAWGWRDDDVLLHALPIFHVHGLFVAMHCVFLTGTSMVFLPGFDAETFAGQLAHSTVAMGVPTFYTRLLARPDFGRETCANMRLFVSGSAPLTEQTFHAFEARTGHRILERYGMSETLMNTSNPLDGERVAGTVGFALPGVATRISAQGGETVATGAVGEIEVRGPNVFSGYWRMPDKTAEEFRPDGFFRTGDMGFLDAEGRVTIVGRAKDVVISGGYNVYPKEVEDLLEEMPEVAETAVIGVPHPDFGEGVVAVVVPAADEVGIGAVEDALRGRLARFKQPKRVVNLDALPRNAMGKVQKNALRERFGGLFEEDPERIG